MVAEWYRKIKDIKKTYEDKGIVFLYHDGIYYKHENDIMNLFNGEINLINIRQITDEELNLYISIDYLNKKIKKEDIKIFEFNNGNKMIHHLYSPIFYEIHRN